MSINNNIKILTKQYYDTQIYIDQINKKLHQIRENKKQIETKLISAITDAGLQNQAITYNDKTIFIGQENSYDTLSYKFLEQCLMKLFNNNTAQVKNIIKFIKNERQKTSSRIIKIK